MRRGGVIALSVGGVLALLVGAVLTGLFDADLHECYTSTAIITRAASGVANMMILGTLALLAAILSAHRAHARAS